MTKRISTLAILAMGIMVFSCKNPIVEPEPIPEPEPEDPVLSVETAVEIEGKAGQYGVPFSLENPVDGVSLSATSQCDWIYDIKPSDDQILFNAGDNLSFPRTAEMTVGYGDKLDEQTVTITQKTFDFPSFGFTVSDITTKGAKIVITPKAHKNNYFFEVFSKAAVDKFTSLDVNSVGDFDYADGLYQDDITYLKNLAHSNGLLLNQALKRLPNMYKETTEGESVEINYTDLKPEIDYYVIAYGMDITGKRTTEICLFLFRTTNVVTSDLTFSGSVSGITQTSARVTITPSNSNDLFYWTFASETDMANYTLQFMMENMVENIKDYAAAYGLPLKEFLSKGTTVSNVTELVMGTKYTIIAWGMDEDGNTTTDAQAVFNFTTKSHDVTDNCQFGVEFTSIEAMDVKVKVTPTSDATKYYIAFIDEKRCTNYNDFQMVTRIVNMENERMRQEYYGAGVTWDNIPGILQGTTEVWGRKDLLWTFEPEHSYRVYIFGINSNGTVTTEITRKDVKTVAPDPTNVTFKVSLNAASDWHIARFDIVPSNDDDYYMPFLVKTSDLETYRYNDGTLMEREIMDRIRDIYEDEIAQYIHRGNYTFVNSWTSDDEYSLLLFGYAGSNTTPMFEYKFKSPAIPFGKANCDISYTYELFNGDDLAAMAPAVWGSSRGECVMKVNISVTGNPANYYFGLWPPKENFASTGGIDHLVMLCQNEATTGDNIINKNFGILKPWWNGAGMGDGFFTTAEGEVLDAMPWSITAYAEDEDHNYSPLHYEIFIPVKQPEAEVTGKYKKGYKEPYDFWSGPAASDANVKTLIFNVPKPEISK